MALRLRETAVVDPFGDFYRCHHAPMVRLAYLLTGSPAVAEDLVQDAFLRLQPRWGRVEQPVAYLRRAVVNACNSWHRRRRVERAHAVAVGTPAVYQEPDEVWDALGGLSARRRAVLVLRFYADLSEADTAKALGCRPGTVKSLTSRALADLRKVLEP